ncbi:bifunctional phosphoribosylaminoimidazolecarboxamide formyltransferase/IMP cyclohydrolase, partial [Klebsiella pneumoniae]|nr:bifunctional phosphoribosylaminoimidazolecarboxamide formyltransferase/IMP cyclohydrolase [Klebsiella pneumoniae]
EPACCALKHNTPCGVAVGNDSYEAYMKAYEVDPTSIFGGIIGFNRKVDKKTAEEMVKIFLEVVAAPDYDDDALEVLKSKKNLRVLKFNNVPKAEKYMVTVDGAMLVQEEDRKLVDEIKVVTEKVPTDEEMKDLLFGMK